MSDTIQVRGTLFWPSLKRVSNLSGKYQFELGELSDAAIEALEKMGLNPRFREDKAEKGTYISFKSNNPIRAYDTNGEEIHAEVGNGSKGVVVVKPYSWSFNGKKGTSPSCVKLVITDLEVYEPVDQVDADLEDAL